ncbi:MAG: ABC transporter ATP-binding protein [Silvanigrellales bacterium]|nr:ABC transporter ATP-binding protein [Silvanigrellales bacterium]
MPTLVRADALNFAWTADDPPLFQDFSLTLESGKLYGLLGRNGAGKTSLVKLLCGLLTPTRGDVVHTPSGLSVSKRLPPTLCDVVFVAESSVLPELPVDTFGRLAGRLYPRFDFPRFLELLNTLEVPARKSVASLSFGQRRKAHVAFALATDASLVFLDEPTNGLDIAAQIALRRLLVAQAAPHRSLVVSTHHVREFENILDTVLVLEKGRLLAQESVEDLRSKPGATHLENWYAGLIGLKGAPEFSQKAKHDGEMKTRGDYENL